MSAAEGIKDATKAIPACLWFLFAAIVLYGLAGSPTPDDPGIVEAVIGVLLILSSVLGIAARNGLSGFGQGAFEKSLQALFVCGLIVPVASAAWFGNAPMLIVRDVAAFAFLGLALFLGGSFRGDDRGARILCGVLVFSGTCFCLRTLLPVFNIWTPEGELLYLSNSPLAMFAGVAAGCAAWRCLTVMRWRSIVLAAFWLAVLGIVVSAMLLDLQRATIGAVVLSVAVIAVFDIVKTPKRTALPLLVFAGLVACCYPLFADSAAALARKTAQVGMNMRLAEAGGVYDAVVASPVSFVAGRGWGAVFASPAVGGLDVNYTHSLLSLLLLKGGVLLLVPGLLLAGTGLASIVRLLLHRPERGLALLWPFAIPCLLYASYKSLDYGLILLMIAVWCRDVWSDRPAGLKGADASCTS